MEYIYSAMLLHKAGKDITEDAVKGVLSAAGVTADEARVKALVAALDGVNIEEAIEKAAVAVPVAAPAASAAGEDASAKEAQEEKSKEEEKKAEETAAAGLGALFG